MKMKKASDGEGRVFNKVFQLQHSEKKTLQVNFPTDPDARSQYQWTSYVEWTCWYDRIFSLNPNISRSKEVILGYQSLIFVWNLWGLGEAPQQSELIHSVRMLLCRWGVGSLRAEGRKVIMELSHKRGCWSRAGTLDEFGKKLRRDESFEHIDQLTNSQNVQTRHKTFCQVVKIIILYEMTHQVT